MAFSARTYIEIALTRLGESLNCTFSQYNTPMSEVEHPRLDDFPLLSPANHSKYRSLIGYATWIVTLGRFDIAYTVNTYARFSQAPREGHMVGLKRVFGYLKKWIKGTTLIDPNYPDHSQFPAETYDQWKEFYPDAEGPMPAQDMLPTPLGARSE